MKKSKTYWNIILSTALCFAACEKQTTWDIKPSERFILADCIITNEFKNHVLKLYYSSGELNQEPEVITGAIAEITDGTNRYNFIEKPGEPGEYVSTDSFMATAGNVYSLIITVGNLTDTATATMAAINPMETFEIIQSDSLYRFVYHESSSPSMLEVHYNWSLVPEYCEQYGSCEAAETFYTLDNIDVSKIFAPDRLKIEFPRGTQIIRRKYSVNNEHQEFLRSLLLETEWRGGVFDTEQGNVPTNFSGQIRGWFAACMVLADTIQFD